MNKGLAQVLLYGGVSTALASAFAELQTAKTWAEVFSPPHFFAALGAVATAIGALYHPSPDEGQK